MANILIVEDEPRMRRLLEIALGEDGHTVQIAPDAETAIKALRAAEYGSSSGARASDSGSPRAFASQGSASQGSDSVAASKLSNKGNVASGPSASGASQGSDSVAFAKRSHSSGTTSDNSNSIPPFNLVLTDVKLPGMSGLDFLQEVKRTNASLPVIIMTAYGSVETAVEAMKLGASDYVLKPFTMAEMKLVIAKELDVQAVRDENRSLKEALGHRYQFRNIIARSRKMQEVLALVERVATTNSTVLVGGESGVGKDLIARAIHQHSRRAQGPFIKINSTAIPDTLLESELFGYERGAFTGAVAAKPGKFELADKGTLFLDEIGDVPGPIQVKLLRVLQEREFERLGGTRTLKVDVRLVAATNRDLRAALEQGTFREDLYYRLNVVPIDIPPLRERKEDIPELVTHFLARYAQESGRQISGVTPAALKQLMDYHWPGNVRQLENTVERAVALSTGPTLDVADIHLDSPRQVFQTNGPFSQNAGSATGQAGWGARSGQAGAANSGTSDGANSAGWGSASGIPFLPDGMTLEQWEDEMIREALRRANGNKSQAARLLGLSRNALRYRLGKLGVEDSEE